MRDGVPLTATDSRLGQFGLDEVGTRVWRLAADNGSLRDIRELADLIRANQPCVALTGAGATFPQPIYSKWFADYAAKTGIRVTDRMKRREC